MKYPAASSGVFRSPEVLVSGLIPNILKGEKFVSRPKERGIKPSPRIKDYYVINNNAAIRTGKHIIGETANHL